MVTGLNEAVEGPREATERQERENQRKKVSVITDFDRYFEYKYFKIKSIISVGKTKVFHEVNNQIALKCIDLWKQSHKLPALHWEIEMYRLLSGFQGIFIPKLVLQGYWEGGMYCMGLSLCGTNPKTLSESQMQSVLASIDAIHSRGVILNNIKKKNILVDENGKVYLIDFRKATRDSSKSAQENERNKLLECITKIIH